MGIATERRPRISHEFIAAHQRLRMAKAMASSIADRGYRSTTVSHVVSGAGIARNTFYDNFANKGECANALVAEVCPSIEYRDGDGSRFTFAVELAATALLRNGDALGHEIFRARLAFDAMERSIWVRDGLDTLGESDEGEELQASLPPGRHGLPRQFVEANQRARLLSATASAIVDVGLHQVTVADVAGGAQVSRRTFYDHFDNVLEIATAMIEDLGAGPLDVDVGSGLGAIVAEAVAAATIGEKDQALKTITDGREIAAAIEEITR